MEAADPLSDWLPTEDVWGNEFGADHTPVFKAVRPDPATEAKLSSKTVEGKQLPTAMTDQAKAVTEKAFYFPTGVDVWTPERGAAPTGLQFDIAVAYLPSYGTLMVDATVLDPGTGEEEAIRCAVHYANAEGGFYYSVRPEGTELKLPDFENEDQSFAEWVSGASGWAEAPTGPVELPEGETGRASRLQVHMGTWPDASEYEEDMQAFAQHVLRLQESRSGHLQAEVENREQLRTVARSAPPPSRIDGPEGLGPILQSGEFEVNGNVYFAPLQPMQPAPRIPSSLEEARKQNMSFERLRFSYPKEAAK